MKIEDKNEMKKIGRCEICGQTPSIQELVIDHEHGKSYPRGVLCNKCNTGLGMFNDDIDLLLGAIEYVKRS